MDSWRCNTQVMYPGSSDVQKLGVSEDTPGGDKVLATYSTSSVQHIGQPGEPEESSGRRPQSPESSGTWKSGGQ